MRIIITDKCGTNHKWKISQPKINFSDEWDEQEKVFLVYEDWCTECHVLRKRVEVFSRTTPVKVVEELPNYEI